MADADDHTDEATFAVIAHGLLNSLTVVKGTAGMLRASLPEVPTAQMQAWFDSIESQTEMMVSILQDVVRGLPPQTLIVLDELNEDAAVRVSGRH